MTTTYTFIAAFTSYGEAYVPTPAPTCTVINRATGAALASAQATTALSGATEVVKYDYVGADDLDTFGKFVTTDANVDQKTLYSYVPSQVVNRLDARITSRAVPGDVAAGLTAQGYTVTRAGYLDTLNGLVAAIWAFATRTLTAFGFTVNANADPNTALIKAKTDNLPASPAATGAAMTLTAPYDAAKTAASQASVNLLGAPMQASSFIAPDNAKIALIDAKTTNLPAQPAAVGSVMNLAVAYDAAKSAASQASVSALGSPLQDADYVAPDNATISLINAKTTNLPAQPAAVGSVMNLDPSYDAAKSAASALGVWEELTLNFATPGTIGYLISTLLDVAVSTRASDISGRPSLAVTVAEALAAASGSATITTTYSYDQTFRSTTLEDLSAVDNILFAVKSASANADNEALILVSKTGGLMRVNGAEYAEPTDGFITVTGIPGEWDVNVFIKREATALLVPNGMNKIAGLKYIVGSNALPLWEGICQLVNGIVRALA